MGRQDEPLGQGVVRGFVCRVSPTHIIRMSGLIFWARFAPHFLLMVQKCEVHPSSAQTPESGVTCGLTGLKVKRVREDVNAAWCCWRETAKTFSQEGRERQAVDWLPGLPAFPDLAPHEN